MNNLLSITKGLQWVHKSIGWNSPLLPTVVVIGDCRSGKSSVVESLIGGTLYHYGDCLPTKRPVIINLKHSDKSYVKFSHKPEEIFTDWGQVAKEIRGEMSNTNYNKGHANLYLEPIFVEVKSRTVLDLTIVDLPGMPTGEVAAGDLTPESQIIIKRTALKYLRAPDAIIICIVAGNTEVLKAESFKLVKSVDPTGIRSLLVMTKLDLMDGSSGIQEYWEQCASFGFRNMIGVICRSSKCIKGKKTINDALIKEKKCLKLRFSAVADRHGIPYLNKILTEMLSDHLNLLLPGTIEALRCTTFQIQHDLDSLRCESKSRNKVILEEATRYANAYCAALNGTVDDIKTQELVGGARISYIIQEVFGKSLDSIHPLHGITRPQILTALRNACGIRPDVLFIPETCFESLTRKQITLMANPCRQLVDFVYEEMLRLIKDCSSTLHPRRYPRIYDLIYSIAGDILVKRRAESAQLVEELLAMETAYINTLDSEFQRDIDSSKTAWLSSKGLQTVPYNISAGHRIGRTGWHSSMKLQSVNDESRLIVQPPSANISQDSLAKEEQDVTLVETLVTSYFSAVRRNLKHSVPKAIMLRMVNYVHEHLYHTILENLQNQACGDDVLQKPEALLQQCSQLETSLKALERAEAVVQDIKSQLTKGITKC